jgi:hypothetical protein
MTSPVRELLSKASIERKNMKKSSLKELDYLIAWVVFFISATIGGAVVDAIGGGIIGGILGVLHVSNQAIRTAGGVVGFILALPVSYLVFRFVVAKFVVEKVEAAAAAAATAPPQPLAQAA